jgi:Protein of unknown function (DUF1501)
MPATVRSVWTSWSSAGSTRVTRSSRARRAWPHADGAGSFGGRSGYFGRDHRPKWYTIWMAGGGIKPGMTYGATDEWGFWAVDGKTSPLDVFPTALHQLGIA